MNDQDNQAHIDPARSTNLPGTPWRAAVAVGPDGEESLWLVSPDPGQQAGCACPTCAPHEQPHPAPQKEQTP